MEKIAFVSVCVSIAAWHDFVDLPFIDVVLVALFLRFAPCNFLFSLRRRRALCFNLQMHCTLCPILLLFFLCFFLGSFHLHCHVLIVYVFFSQILELTPRRELLLLCLFFCFAFYGFFYFFCFVLYDFFFEFFL